MTIAPDQEQRREQLHDGGTAPAFFEVTTLKAAPDTAEGLREVAGLAVPYDEDLERIDWLTGASRQRIAAGAAKFRPNVTLYYGHDHLAAGLPIGRVLEAEDEEGGARIRARISATAKGEEVYTLVRDEVLERFSIGFYPVKSHLEEADTVLVHDEIDVFEVSIVPHPAYDTATIDEVLSARRPTLTNPTQEKDPAMTQQQMTPASADDVTALSQAVDNLERRIATLGDAGDQGEALLAAPAPSYGEFLKMAAAGAPEAITFLEQIATLAATTGDLGGHIKDAWVGDLLRQAEKARKVINLFGTSPLPAEGMGVEYGLVKPTSDTTQVAKQAAEGDTLAYGKIAFGVDNAPVETFGGWSDMSRQVVERSRAAVVEKFFRALVRRYMQTTEGAVRATAVNPANAVEVGSAVHDLGTAAGWIGFLVDAEMVLEDEGMSLDFLIVAPDVFKTLANLRDASATEGDHVLNRDSGKIEVVGLKGNLYSVPVIPVQTTAGTVRGAHADAIDVWEAAGAPFRLQDGDITNLTQAMSVYGYMAHAVTDLAGIVRPNDGV